MKSFKDFFNQNKKRLASLTIFDIDDTLFKTDTYVHIKKDGKTIKKLTPAEYNVYKLKPKESFDFSEFRSSKIFHETAKPIDSVFKTAKSIINRFSEDKEKRIIVVTARQDLDNRELFLATFKKYGLNTDKVFIERAGNLSLSAGISGAEAKKRIIDDYMSKQTYNIVRMFDDHHENLDKFMELKEKHKASNFIAYYVNKDGNFEKYAEK